MKTMDWQLISLQPPTVPARKRGEGGGRDPRRGGLALSPACPPERISCAGSLFRPGRFDSQPLRNQVFKKLRSASRSSASSVHFSISGPSAGPSPFSRSAHMSVGTQAIPRSGSVRKG